MTHRHHLPRRQKLAIHPRIIVCDALRQFCVTYYFVGKCAAISYLQALFDLMLPIMETTQSAKRQYMIVQNNHAKIAIVSSSHSKTCELESAHQIKFFSERSG
jgi:hypothetical protein